MKRITAFILTLSLLSGMLISVASCRSKNTDDTDNDNGYTSDEGEQNEQNETPAEFAGVDIEKEIDVSYVRTPEKREEEISEQGLFRTGNGRYVPEETVRKYPQLTNLPTLYIELDDDKRLDEVQKGQYLTGVYTLVDNSVISSFYENTLSIKGRGNWSWAFAQKPYTLKLDESADLLGMGEAKKWVLVTVHSDKTMMHNFMTQKLAKALGLKYTCDNEYVDVIVNGKYAGTYVLTEKIQIHENRVDIADISGYLFEIEMVYRHSCRYCVVLNQDKNDNSHSVHLELIDHSTVDLGESARVSGRWMESTLARLQDKVNQINEAMTGDDWETLCSLINVESFVNWYILNEFTRNYDSAFVTSCYCFIDGYGKINMGPVWDFDTCYGIQDSTYNSQHIQDAPWYKWLFRYCPEFVELVKERWTWLRTEGAAFDNFIDAIDCISEDFKSSEILEHTVFPDSELCNVPFDEAVDFYKTWIDNRLVWMDSQFLMVTEPEEASGAEPEENSVRSFYGCFNYMKINADSNVFNINKECSLDKLNFML